MNNAEPYGDGYMEPEEEWEREGLLDPAWEKQQKKAFFVGPDPYDRSIPLEGISVRRRGSTFMSLTHACDEGLA
ncbi:hypothetical protein J437_LFUL008765 [Ladona fulva]|uniref:Uncharacterized protein n=1 Tax=Ladona fulva TaxID=123851 RepID=A0A8K0K435_LADFU|nr:hypothetical protein J437_LFUL008764 [Ladona fulva]KAG8227957.1 hypothetical protein J437_LFUL008765 [Ladona fulva]